MLELLTGLGYAVQLKYDATETTWESHGWVKILLDGSVLAESADCLHNRNYGAMKHTFQSLILGLPDPVEPAEPTSPIETAKAEAAAAA